MQPCKKPRVNEPSDDTNDESSEPALQPTAKTTNRLKRSIMPSYDTATQPNTKRKIDEQRDATKEGAAQPTSQPDLKPTPKPITASHVVDVDVRLSCAYCGQVEGHESECLLGGKCILSLRLLPIADHSVGLDEPTDYNELDWSMLADAADRFNSDPSNMHEASLAESEPETADGKISLVDFVKTQQSYKDNRELEELPDDVMVLQWAIKTLPDVEIERVE